MEKHINKIIAVAIGIVCGLLCVIDIFGADTVLQYTYNAIYILAILPLCIILYRREKIFELL